MCVIGILIRGLNYGSFKLHAFQLDASFGFWICCLFADGTVAEWRQMLDINVVALCLCSRETVKSIKERNTNLGHIININRYEITNNLSAIIHC